MTRRRPASHCAGVTPMCSPALPTSQRRGVHPPEFANRMLDTVAAAWAADHGGANLWANKASAFL